MNKEVVCIAGGTGLVGGRLVESLREDYIIHILTRSPKIDSENIKYFKWEPENGVIDIKALACDHLINLTGAGIADRRWTQSRKEMLVSSRVNSNKTIYEA
ncbi:MAG TPA: NAD-dependent epimerase/dehydratase family protein, partial [Saprospiraceae bacterium]|nr:NAD-dependent epimerase/dehydratase family protein [Saprospiraceae bacterium]